MRRWQQGRNRQPGGVGPMVDPRHQLVQGEHPEIRNLNYRHWDRRRLEELDDRRGEALRECRLEQLRQRLRASVQYECPPNRLIDWSQAVQDPDKLNDETTYQRCFACCHRNESGLKLTFRRVGERIVPDYTPAARFQGFPGFLHGGARATRLAESMGRTRALRQELLLTGKLVI